MRRAPSVLCALVCASAALVATPAARAAEPPNPTDPCVGGRKDTCGTTGVGYYRSNRYGTRWLGDFKNAVPGPLHAFCIDLRFWYPSRDYVYKEDTGGTLRNRGGKSVPLPNQQRIAYAIWTYGRSTDPDRQAAVALYVHSQMGDARPGEVAPGQFGSTVSSVYARVKRDAERLHGPYRIETTLPPALKVGRQTTASIRVVAVGGAALPNLSLRLSVRGASGVPAEVKTNGSGVASVPLTPTGNGELKLTATASGLPATLPRVFRPTSAAAAPNGQRLVLPAAQTVTKVAGGTPAKTALSASTVAVPTEILAGAPSRDRVTIGGAEGWSGTVQVHLYGPFPTVAAIDCTGTPAAKTSFSASGSGTTTTLPLTPTRPGWYVYQEQLTGDAGHTGLTTPCNVAAERVKVVTQPTVVTTVSAQTATPGAPITDRVEVTGLLGQSATVQAFLYGPYASRGAITCTGAPAWTGSIAVATDGTYATEPFTPTVPGYYAYRESIAGSSFVRAVQTPCGDAAETTILHGVPRITTRTSNQHVKPGSAITDKAVVTGLGVLEAPVTVELWGPFATRPAVHCSGKPAWRGTFTAKGDGTYTTRPVHVQKAGYYTYRESIAPTAAFAGFTGVCGATSETTLARARPTLVTAVSNKIVRPGSKLIDTISVRGLGRTPATVEVEVYGPFATRARVACSGPMLRKGRLRVSGNGVYHSAPVLAPRAGFYVFRERLLDTPLVAGAKTACSDEAETALAAPLVVTGRGDRTRKVRARSAGALTPVRLRLDSQGIDAPVSPVGIDLARGVLGVSAAIDRTGWWRDGAEPGSRSGAILIAGHVDSATKGAGAFFRLRQARAGQHVRLTTAGGRTFRYRVVSVRKYPKSALPLSVWSRRGPARLVLVTCGGRFDYKARHYRDNIVLTAVPG